MKKELSFEDFYVYDGNKVAFLAAKKIAEFPGELFNPLYVYAGTGLGKTHLLWTLYCELKKKIPVLFFTAKEFERYLKETEVFDKPLIVDDLHMIAETYYDTVLRIIDSYVATNQQICFSGSVAPRELKNFNVKLLSLLEGGLVCDIQAPKEMSLVDIIKKKSTEAGIILPDDVVLELAQISTGSIRIIEGMINRLIAYSSLGNVVLDSNSIRMILKDFYPKGIYSPVSSLLEELKKDASDVLQDLSEKLDVRDEYREKAYIWEMKGFDTSSLKPFLDGDVDVLKKEYDTYIKKIQRLIELQRDFGAVDVSTFPDEAMRIESMLFSPDRADEIEELLLKMEKATHAVAPDKGFAQYVIGGSNSNVFDVYTNHVLKNLGEKFNPFIIYGKRGTGKTRFLEAVYTELTSQNKKVKFSDVGSRTIQRELDALEEYDILLLDNFDKTFSAPAEVRTAVCEVILLFIKSGKAVMLTAYKFPSNVSLSDNEKSMFGFAIETELKEPSPDVVEAYIRSKLTSHEAQKLIDSGLPTFTSFYDIDAFLASRPVEKEAPELVPLGLPGEELLEEIVEEKHELVPVLREKVEKPEVDASSTTMRAIDEQRFQLHEIAEELIEDNY